MDGLRRNIAKHIDKKAVDHVSLGGNIAKHIPKVWAFKPLARFSLRIPTRFPILQRNVSTVPARCLATRARSSTTGFKNHCFACFLHSLACHTFATHMPHICHTYATQLPHEIPCMKLTFVCAVKNLVFFNLKSFRLSRFVVLYKESHVASVWQVCGKRSYAGNARKNTVWEPRREHRQAHVPLSCACVVSRTLAPATECFTAHGGPCFVFTKPARRAGCPMGLQWAGQQAELRCKGAAG